MDERDEKTRQFETVVRQRDEAQAEVKRLRGLLADINARANKLCESVEKVQAMLRV